ncbi:uncharacterized protein EDB93DRAFT_1109307 [Suillus bovinus]|uniref:uncharacterized protein n=1 Tax=Suillus bovinus TaxID=48563 RepID=UPI001B8713A9|nr:uncharacterized protein EDB93DRAFT_1109307 [Suillus bovinus]KAG2127451.1 hypothetical protein EDB93DRAFT_1109307 [Suillus bovinus]
MTNPLEAVTATANAVFRRTGDMVEHLLGQALQLNGADAKHIPIAIEMEKELANSCIHSLQSCMNTWTAPFARLSRCWSGPMYIQKILAASRAPSIHSLLAMGKRWLQRQGPLR